MLCFPLTTDQRAESAAWKRPMLYPRKDTNPLSLLTGTHRPDSSSSWIRRSTTIIIVKLFLYIQSQSFNCLTAMSPKSMMWCDVGSPEYLDLPSYVDCMLRQISASNAHTPSSLSLNGGKIDDSVPRISLHSSPSHTSSSGSSLNSITRPRSASFLIPR